MTTKRKKIRSCFLKVFRYTGHSRGLRLLTAIISGGFCLGLLTTGCTLHHGVVPDNAAQLSIPTDASSVRKEAVPVIPETKTAVTPFRKRANFEGEQKSRAAQRVADWAVDSGDHRSMPFVIVDKVDAKVFVFDASGRLRGAAPALLGLARGDDSVPGIGNKKLSEIRDDERTTPAGRFVASLGQNYRNKEVLWVDYDGAVSLHRVVSAKASERRLERLATPTPLDNRISYGCINVPVKFFDNVVGPVLRGTGGIVYVLPETRSHSATFASYYEVGDSEDRVQLQTSTRNIRDIPTQ